MGNLSAADLARLVAMEKALLSDDLRSIHRCHSQSRDHDGAAAGYVCGFDGGSLDFSRDACSHTLPERIAAFCVAMRIAAPSLLAEVGRLRALLLESRREHYTCEDPWYSCSQATGDDECSNEYRRGDPCDCGAAEWNAKIDAALSPSPEVGT